MLAGSAERTRQQAAQRRYRDRRRAEGLPAVRGERGRHVRKPRPDGFELGRFVAVDGEGFDAGEVETRIVKQRGRGRGQKAIEQRYESRPHHYALLAASDGSEIYNPSGALSTKQCLDFLLDIKRNDPSAILVMFGATYDWTHMLEDLPRDLIEEMLCDDPAQPWRQKRCEFSIGEHDYRVVLLPRKNLTIWRWPTGADKYREIPRRDGSIGYKLEPDCKVTVWDSWGFFQSSLVHAMQERLSNDPDTPLIERMKPLRSQFVRADYEMIRDYNRRELTALCKLMETIRDGHAELGLMLSRWDGVGASAASAFRRFAVKDHLAEPPEPVREAACCAFSGGHIEAPKIGYRHLDGLPIYHYDITSAYPHQLRQLPSLKHGAWRHGEAGTEPPPGFTMVHVAFRWKPPQPFYPLFFRACDGSITYPEYGQGWYWFAEYKVAADHAKKHAFQFDVLEWWHFDATGNDRPFSWIEDFFAARQRLIAESKRTGVPNGLQYTYKIAMNAGYGKLAQQIGARVDRGVIRPPGFFQLEYAGFVTAGCRAQLMAAALQKPQAIIAFATDALFSTEPLAVDCPPVKVLGTWEASLHDGITMVMPGVYWLHDPPSAGNPTGLTHHSRGFDLETMKTPALVMAAWRKGEDYADLPARRMITLGSALASETFWQMRGRFVTTVRALAVNGDNSKRCTIPMSRSRPDRGLIATRPRDPPTPFWDDLDASAPYSLAWDGWQELLDGAEPAEFGPDQQGDAAADIAAAFMV